MKIKILFSLLILACSAFLYSCKDTEKLKKLQKSFIPDVVSNIYIGMPLEDLKAARGMNNLYVVNSKDLVILKEESTKDSISLIQYQFGKDKLLYEIIIEYVAGFNTATTYAAKYGAVNNGSEWLFTLNKKMKLKIWVYQNRLCIADSKHFKL
jgi:hypothetical protein